MSSTCLETRRYRIAPLDPSTYRRHAIHGPERVWAETNCYTDLVIELIHSLGHEPAGLLAFTLAIDFEGDQWTFFKPPQGDLYTLYGLDLQELAIWRPLVDHVAEQVALGRHVLVELDAWFLPDTAGTAYRQAHSKTTVAVNEIDLDERRLGYFHNAGYFAVEGEDFSNALLLAASDRPRLPPYVEYIKRRPGFSAPHGRDLVDASLESLRRELGRLPRDDPFARFRARFESDLRWLMQAPIAAFHAYAFATLRQYGACFELAETYLRWLAANGVAGLDDSAQRLHRIAETAKVFQFQLARAVSRRKPLDLSPLDTMGEERERALEPLVAKFA